MGAICSRPAPRGQRGDGCCRPIGSSWRRSFRGGRGAWPGVLCWLFLGRPNHVCQDPHHQHNDRHDPFPIHANLDLAPLAASRSLFPWFASGHGLVAALARGRLAGMGDGIAHFGVGLDVADVVIVHDAQAAFLEGVGDGQRDLGLGFDDFGAVGLDLGAVFLLVTLVQLLAAKTEVPLWGCYGIVGGAVTILGLVVLLRGRKFVGDVRLAPPPATARALKENLAWLKNLKERRTVRRTA